MGTFLARVAIFIKKSLVLSPRSLAKPLQLIDAATCPEIRKTPDFLRKRGVFLLQKANKNEAYTDWSNAKNISRLILKFTEFNLNSSVERAIVR